MPNYMDTLYAAFCGSPATREYQNEAEQWTEDRMEVLRTLWPLMDAQPDNQASHKALFRLLDDCEHLSSVQGRSAFATGLRLGIRIGESLSEAEAPKAST